MFFEGPIEGGFGIKATIQCDTEQGMSVVIPRLNAPEESFTTLGVDEVIEVHTMHTVLTARVCLIDLCK